MERKLLQELQALPLDEKAVLSKRLIREWYEHWQGDVYISFSGGLCLCVSLGPIRYCAAARFYIVCNTLIISRRCRFPFP